MRISSLSTPVWWNNQPQNLKTHNNGIWHRLNWTYKKLVIQWICLYEKFHRSSVSCLFTKHLLTCGFLTIDGRENLCYPKHNSIPSTFFFTSAVCLVFGPNVNKKTIGMGIFGKNQLLGIKLPPKIIFKIFFTAGKFFDYESSFTFLANK